MNDDVSASQYDSSDWDFVGLLTWCSEIFKFSFKTVDEIWKKNSCSKSYGCVPAQHKPIESSWKALHLRFWLLEDQTSR